jgi:UDP-N-acetylglucosamine 2-epimerase (non-hydrolysing)
MADDIYILCRRTKKVFIPGDDASGVSTAVILGTRPELVKLASVIEALEGRGEETTVVHTGQHYDDALSEAFLRDLGMREPDVRLGVGSGSQAAQTAEMMVGIERAFSENRPDTVLVQGDTNTVLAGALAAAKMGIRVGHVEAGLRSGDRRMPEEYNRRVADHVSHLLFAPTKESERILRSEKVWGRIYVTGNTVIDACEKFVPVALRKRGMASKMDEGFILVTAHRAENVDDPEVLESLVEVLEKAPLPAVYPLHPRTRKRLDENGLLGRLEGCDNVRLLPPAGYLDFLALMAKCRFIFTDSGGIQEEATSPSIRKRVLVFRRSTERPEAVKAGYATVVGTSPARILKAMRAEVKSPSRPRAKSPYGDGRAGERIARIVAECKERSS